MLVLLLAVSAACLHIFMLTNVGVGPANGRPADSAKCDKSSKQPFGPADTIHVQHLYVCMAGFDPVAFNSLLLNISM